MNPSTESAESALAQLNGEVIQCRACPRLVAWREKVAREKRAAFADEEYWGRPVPSFGDPDARVLVVGLAPAAHGANRTGRMFTGDRSGEWLYRALHRAGFASRPESVARNDGLTLNDCWITAGVRCAPPANRPTPTERKRCRPFLERELEILLPGLRCIVALGGFAFDHTLRLLRDRGLPVPSPKPRFGHGVEVPVEVPADVPVRVNRDAGRISGDPDGGLPSSPTPQRAPASRTVHLLASYHPSQQNTFTGTLTEEAFDAIWTLAREIARGSGGG
jgi:uracil-DNA glycosylase